MTTQEARKIFNLKENDVIYMSGLEMLEKSVISCMRYTEKGSLYGTPYKTQIEAIKTLKKIAI